MQQKYVYAYNGVVNFLRGILPLPQKGSRIVTAYSGANLIWRNHFTQSYKVGQAYLQQPLDLSTLLFIRTRERLLLENKVNAPQRVMKSGKANKLTQNTTEKSLTGVNEDLVKAIPVLQNSLYVLSPQQGGKVPDLPVAFASNTLYVLERNGAGAEAREAYELLLLPILR